MVKAVGLGLAFVFHYNLIYDKHIDLLKYKLHEIL